MRAWRGGCWISRRGARPQGGDQLVTGHRTVPVQNQVRQQRAAEAARQPAFKPASVNLEPQVPAEMDPYRRGSCPSSRHTDDVLTLFGAG